jgi:DNA-binding transcriptional LysR family regulator
MNTSDIQTLVSIVQFGGVTRAATQLHRSQPAITRRLKLLEHRLGAPLFERRKDGIVLTETGRTFLPYGESMLATLKDGLEAVRALRGEEHGSTRLALVGTLAATTLVSQLKRFTRKHRNVRLELRTANSREVGDLVRRGDVDLGLRYFRDPSPELVSQQVALEKMVVACSPDHPWAGRPLRDPGRLTDECWVAFPVDPRRGESFAHVVRRQLVVANLEGARTLEIDSLTAQKRMVEAGLGIAHLPESGIQEELEIGSLKIIDAPRLTTSVPVFVIHRKKGYLGGASRALLEEIATTPLVIQNNRRRRPGTDGSSAAR